MPISCFSSKLPPPVTHTHQLLLLLLPGLNCLFPGSFHVSQFAFRCRRALPSLHLSLYLVLSARTHGLLSHALGWNPITSFDAEIILKSASGSPFQPGLCLFNTVHHSGLLPCFPTQKDVSGSSCTPPAPAGESAPLLPPRSGCWLCHSCRGVTAPRPAQLTEVGNTCRSVCVSTHVCAQVRVHIT